MAAAGVGYLTSQNPEAQPSDVGVQLRVMIIGTLTVTAMYAQTSVLQQRMALLLCGACVFSALWLLNGSGSRFAFSVGVLFSAPAVVVAYYLMLAHPRGTLRPGSEVRFVTLLGGAAVVLWTVATLTSRQPPLRTLLVACSPHCPRNSFFVGSGMDGALPVLRTALRLVWAAFSVGGIVLLGRRWRSASGPLRRALFAVWIASCLAALLLLGYVVAQRSGSDGLVNAFATAYVAMWAVIPLAILAGLAAERLFMGQALARFVSRLARDEEADPAALMAATLGDPTLSIAYVRPATGAYVDFSGAPVTAPESVAGREVSLIERHGRPVAVVAYDRDLADQRPFIRAAGDAAVMHLAQAQLLADLRASTADLVGSRLRLVEAAQAERQRIERDLHDGVQQDLIGLRLKLAVAADAVTEDPARGQHMIAAAGRQLDDVLESVRTLAQGIYPAVLQDLGLVEAVRSAARRSPIAVSVEAVDVGRYAQDIEVAIYFCCLEGLQNIVKHAGANAHAAIRFRRDRSQAVGFEIADSGVGFDPASIQAGNGLVNMRDRVEAVGGTLTITSRPHVGTIVRGRVPADGSAWPAR